jgi:hypothetical protein
MDDSTDRTTSPGVAPDVAVAPPAIGGGGDEHKTEVTEGREATVRLSREDMPIALESRPPVVAPDFPLVPRTVVETGLDEGFLLDLALRHIYLGGEVEARALVARMAVDFRVIEELLARLRRLERVGTSGGNAALRGAGLRYRVTERGRNLAEDTLQRDNYTGPAPVPFKQYVSQLGRQRIRQSRVTPERLRAAFGDLVLDPVLLDRLGPALNSGQSIFLHGPPGNGKTSLAEHILEAVGGHAFIPRAVILESDVVRVYDELYHTAEPLDELYDQRWVLSRRPVVVVGGELTLESLDLTQSERHSWYQAPFQVKANSGVLVIDDFGRQRCEPRELLNRWIVPLESGVDYLTFRSGQKVQVPFDNLVVFATNLAPASLVDEAFLRRIRYKIEVGDPSESAYKHIWSRVCEQHDIPYVEGLVDYVLQRHYREAGRPLRCCHPRDLLAQYVDTGRFLGGRPPLTPELVDRICEQYFMPL